MQKCFPGSLRRSAALALAFFLFCSCSFSIRPACAGVQDIPPQLAQSYHYGTYDDSIIIAKERLRELGYFSQKADLTGRVNDTLKNVVKQFQAKNGLKKSGNLDTDLFQVLFDDAAIGKQGQCVPWSTSPFYPMVSSSAPLSQIIALIQEAGSADYTLFHVSVGIIVLLALILILLRLLRRRWAAVKP